MLCSLNSYGFPIINPYSVSICSRAQREHHHFKVAPTGWVSMRWKRISIVFLPPRIWNHRSMAGHTWQKGQPSSSSKVRCSNKVTFKLQIRTQQSRIRNPKRLKVILSNYASKIQLGALSWWTSSTVSYWSISTWSSYWTVSTKSSINYTYS